jgi:SAM-dependent methyltransferase
LEAGLRRPAILDYTGERFVPGAVGADSAAEHYHRYRLAAPLCRGCGVLDVACGEGYGSALVAQDAASVIGIDIAADAIDHASVAYGAVANLSFVTGDAAQLPFEDSSFERVVFYEGIEHVDKPELALAEIARVLTRGGIAIVSTPAAEIAADAAPAVNPFHRRAYVTDEFRGVLAGAFAHVELLGQTLVAGSAIWPLGSAPESAAVELRSVPAKYLVALVAHDAPLPAVPASIDLGESRHLLDERVRFWADAKAAGEALAEVEADQTTDGDLALARTRARLVRADQLRADAARAVLELETRLAATLEELAEARDETEAALRDAAFWRAQLDGVLGSQSWRITRTLRRARRSGWPESSAELDGLRERNGRP